MLELGPILQFCSRTAHVSSVWNRWQINSNELADYESKFEAEVTEELCDTVTIAGKESWVLLLIILHEHGERKYKSRCKDKVGKQRKQWINFQDKEITARRVPIAEQI